MAGIPLVTPKGTGLSPTSIVLDRPDPLVSTRPRRGDAGWPARLLPSLVPGLLMFAIALVDAGRPVLSWDENAPFWVARYLLVVLAPLALLAAVGLLQLLPGQGRPTIRTTALRLLTVFALLAFAVYPGQRSVRGVDAKNGSDYRGAAKIIERYEQPGDGVIYKARTRTLRPGIDYYLRQDQNRPRDLLLARSAADVASLRADEYPDPAAHLAGAAHHLTLITRGRVIRVATG